MRQQLLFLLILAGFSLLSACAHKALKADKFLEKNELAKAKKRIDKAFEKNPRSPATEFMLAKYYSHPVWSFDAVDSAHLYIELVRDTFPSLEKELIEELTKKGLDSVAVAKQALIIDSLAFEKAMSSHTEEAYNEYLNEYQYLTYEEKATELRNQVAYEYAIAQNTTQAVSEFFRKYPDAPQAQSARNVFETLYYEKTTQNEAVEEYRRYLKERPQTDFAEEAASELLNIISAGATEQVIRNFIAQYQNFDASAKAVKLIEGIDYGSKMPLLLTHKKDSRFYFYDLDSEELLSFRLDNVKPDSCSFIIKPFLLTTTKQEKQAYLKTGEKIEKTNIKWIEYLGSGFFKVNDYGREQTLVHYSQDSIYEIEALDFQLIDDFHFAKQESDGWHLVSLLNEPILKMPVDSVWKEKEVYFFKRGEDVAVASLLDLRKSAKSDLKNLSFLYNDYEWLDDQYLRLYSNDYETIVDRNAKLIFPLEKAKYRYFGEFWLKEKLGEFTLLDLNRTPFTEEVYDDYHYRSKVLALKKDSLWTVLRNGVGGFPEFEYDSVRIFNSWLTFASRASSQYLLFQSGQNIELAEGSVFKILKNYNVSFSEAKDPIRFVQVSNTEGYFKLYNGYGKKIKEGERLDISVLTPELLQVHQDKQKQLIDSSGNMIEIEKVEAFGAYQDGLIPILRKKKFGALLVNGLNVIPAHSQSKLEVFLKDSLYLFKENNLLGISDRKANVLLKPEFTSIDFFNDSTAIVEEEGQFALLNIYQNSYLHDNIDTWEKLVFGEETYFVIRKGEGYGVLNQAGKQIIPFIFNELQAYPHKGKLYWLAERRLSEINYIVIAYFDKRGSVLFKEGLNFDDYLETACD